MQHNNPISPNVSKNLILPGLDIAEMIRQGVDPNTGEPIQSIDISTYTPPARTGIRGVEDLGKYDRGFRYGMNQEYVRGANQGAISKLFNGFVNRAESVAWKVAQGAGHLGGFAADVLETAGEIATGAPRTQFIESTFDNYISTVFHNLDEDAKRRMPVHIQKVYAEGNLLTQMIHPEFWAIDAFDGLSFLASAYVPGAILSKAFATTKGISSTLASAGERGKKLSDALQKVKQAVPVLSTQSVNLTALDVISEAGFEAMDTKKMISEQLRNSEQGYTEEEINAKSSEAASRVFGANALALIVPNFYQTKWFGFANDVNVKDIRKGLRYNDLTKSELAGRYSAWKAAKTGAVTEALWQENIQSAIQQYEHRLAEGDQTGRYASYGLDFAEGLLGITKAVPGILSSPIRVFGFEGLGEGLLTPGSYQDDAAKAVFLGMLIGSPMAARGEFMNGVKAASVYDAEAATWDKFKATHKIANGLLSANIKSPYKEFGTTPVLDAEDKSTGEEVTNYVNPKTGDIELDPNKMNAIILRQLKDQKFFEEHFAASVNNSDTWADFNRQMSLASHVWNLAEGGMSKEDIIDIMATQALEFKESIGEDATTFYNDYKQDLERYTDNYFQAWKEVSDISDFSGDKIDHIWKQVLLTTDYYNLAKGHALSTLSSTKAKIVEQVSKMVEDTNNLRNEIINNRSKLKQSYKDEIEKVINLDAKLKAMEDKTTDEAVSIQYQLLEANVINGTRMTASEINPLLGALSSHTFSTGIQPRHAVDEKTMGLKDKVNYKKGRAATLKEEVKKYRREGRSPIDIMNLIIQNKEYVDEGLDNIMLELSDEIDIRAKDAEAYINKVTDTVDTLANAISDEDVSTLDPTQKDLLKALGLNPDVYDDATYKAKLAEIKPALDEANAKRNEVADGARALDSYDTLSTEQEKEKKMLSKAYKNSKAYENAMKLMAVDVIVGNEIALNDQYKSGALEEGSELIAQAIANVKAYMMANKLRTDIDSKLKNKILAKLGKLLKSLEDSYERVAKAEAKAITKQVVYADSVGARTFDLIENEGIIEIIRDIIGDERLDEYLAASERSYEAAYALLMYVQSAATNEQKDKLTAELEKVKVSLREEVRAINPEFSKGRFKTLINEYADNPIKIVSTILSFALKGAHTQKDKPEALKFIYSKDIVELESALTAKDYKGYTKEQQEMLQNFFVIHQSLIAIEEMKIFVQSDLSFAAAHKEDTNLRAKELKKKDDESKFFPSLQQTIILRKVLAFLLGKNKANVLSNTFYVEGIAGSGKTKLIVTTMLKMWAAITGNSVSSVYTASHTEASSKVLYQAVHGTKGTPTTLARLATADLSKLKLIIIDEFPALTNVDARSIINRIQAYNDTVTLDNKIKMVFLGDPSQITREFPSPIINTGTEAITTVESLNVSFRTSVGPINNFAANFRFSLELKEGIPTVVNMDNDNVINAKESNPIGVNNVTREQIIAMATRKNTSRDRIAIVVTNDSEVKTYNDLLAKTGSAKTVEVISYDKVGGREFDEVYIDIDPTLPSANGLPFNLVNAIDLNRALYTAISRAVYFVGIKGRFAKSANVVTTLPKEVDVSTPMLEANQALYLESMEKVEQFYAMLDEGFVPPTPEEVTDDMDKEDIEEDEKREDVLTEEEEEENPEQPEQLDESEEDIGEDTRTEPEVPVSDKTEIVGDKVVHGLYHPTNGNITPGKNNKEYPVLPGDEAHIIAQHHSDGRVYYHVIAVDKNTEYNEATPERWLWRQIAVLGDQDLEDKLFGPSIKEFIAKFDSKNTLARNTITSRSIGFYMTPAMQKAIVATANVEGATPLRYRYSLTRKDFMSQLPDLKVPGSEGSALEVALRKLGMGFVGKDGKHIDWYMKGPDSSTIDWNKIDPKNIFVKIYTIKEIKDPNHQPDELRGEQTFEPLPGVPYLVVKNPRNEKTKIQVAKTQFIRLHPRPIHKEDKYFKDLKSFYDNIIKMEGLLNDPKAKLGSSLFNKMIEAVSFYFTVDEKDDKKPVIFDKSNTKGTKQELVKQLMTINPKIKALNDAQKEELLETIKAIIPQVYGPKKAKVYMSPKEAEKFIKDNPGKYTIDPEYKTKKLKYVKILEITDEDQDKNPITRDLKTWQVKPSSGPAQTAFTAIAQANTKVGDTKIAVEYIWSKLVNNRPVTVRLKAGKSLLTDSHAVMQFLKQLRQLYNNNIDDINEERSAKGLELYPEVMWDADKNSMEDIEDIVKNVKRALKDSKVLEMAPQTIDNLWKELITKAVTSSTLERIVGPKATDAQGYHTGVGEKGEAYSLRIPLHRISPKTAKQKTGINEYGADLRKPENRAHIQSLVGTFLESVTPTKISISIPKGSKVKPAIKPSKSKTKPASEDEEVFEDVTEEEYDPRAVALVDVFMTGFIENNKSDKPFLVNWEEVTNKYSAKFSKVVRDLLTFRLYTYAINNSTKVWTGTMYGRFMDDITVYTDKNNPAAHRVALHIGYPLMYGEDKSTEFSIAEMVQEVKDYLESFPKTGTLPEEEKGTYLRELADLLLKYPQYYASWKGFFSDKTRVEAMGVHGNEAISFDYEVDGAKGDTGRHLVFNGNPAKYILTRDKIAAYESILHETMHASTTYAFDIALGTVAGTLSAIEQQFIDEMTAIYRLYIKAGYKWDQFDQYIETAKIYFPKEEDTAKRELYMVAELIGQLTNPIVRKELESITVKKKTNALTAILKAILKLVGVNPNAYEVALKSFEIFLSTSVPRTSGTTINQEDAVPLSTQLKKRIDSILFALPANSEHRDTVAEILKEPSFSEEDKINELLALEISLISTNVIHRPGGPKMRRQSRSIEVGDQPTGQMISEADAAATFKSMFPNIDPTVLEFTSKLARLELDTPGSKVFGRTINQAVQLLTVEMDGTNKVYEQTLREEIFHFLFRHILSTKQREALLDKLKDEDLNAHLLNSHEQEELLAKKWREYKYNPGTPTIGDRIKNFFKDIAKFFGFLIFNSDTLLDVFDDLSRGFVTSSKTSAYEDGLRYANHELLTSDKGFPNVGIYRKAKRHIMKRMNSILNKHSATEVVINREEAVGILYEEFQKSIASTTKQIADKEKQIAEATVAVKKKRLLMELEALKLDKTMYRVLNGDLKKGKKVLHEMMRIIYPNWTLDSDLIKERNKEAEQERETLDIESIQEMLDSSQKSLQELIEDNIYVDISTKQSDAIKDFLSFMPVPLNVISQEEFLSSKFTFPATAQLFQRIDFSNNDQLIKQIDDLIGSRHTNKFEMQILSMFRQLVVDAHADHPANHKHANIVVHREYAGQKPTYIFVQDPLEQFDMQDIIWEEIIPEVNRREKLGLTPLSVIKSTDVMLSKLHSKINNSGYKISISDFNTLYRSGESGNTLSEIITLFGSLQETDLYLAKRDRGKNSYLRAKALDVQTNVTRNFREAINLFITNQKEGSAPNAFLLRGVGAKIRIDVKDKTSRSKRIEAVKSFFHEMGINSMLLNINDNGLDIIADTLSYILDDWHSNFVTGAKIPVMEEGAKDGEAKQIGEDDMSAADFLDDQKKRIRTLSRIISSSNRGLRNNTILDGEGNKLYKFNNGSYAYDIINTLSKLGSTEEWKGSRGGDKLRLLPEHLRTGFYKHNIFTQGIGLIKDGLMFHDSTVDGWTGKVTPLRNESKKDTILREFGMGFIDMLRVADDELPDYIQFLYPPSNRPRIPGVRVNVLSASQIRESIVHMIMGIQRRPGLDDIKNYDRDKLTNLAAINKALKVFNKNNKSEPKTIQDLNTADVIKVANLTYIELGKEAVEFAKQIIKSEVPFDIRMGDVMKKIGYLTDVEFLEKNKHIAKKVSWANKFKSFTYDNKDSEGKTIRQYKHTLEQILPLVHLFYINNYINGYNLNTLVGGDPAFYKNGQDIVKRFAGLSAAGQKGKVDSRRGMSPTYRVGIVKDDVISGRDIKDILKDMIPDVQQRQDIEDFFPQVGDATDGQGFMLPSRWSELSKGFGRSYKLSNVLKPVHFENIIKWVPIANSKISDELMKKFSKAIEKDQEKIIGEYRYKNGTFEELISYPFYSKYSSIVLTDELIERFPIFRRIREAMERSSTGELIFQSGIKTGNFKDGGVSLENLLSSSYGFKEENIVTLSNNNYRLQLNPFSRVQDNQVAIFTQLMYFLNVLEANDDQADNAYASVAWLIDNGTEKFKKDIGFKNGKYSRAGLVNFLKRTLQGVGNERSLELLHKGISIDNPLITNKALIQMISGMQKMTTGVKFPGAKLVLQSAYGFDKKSAANILQIPEESDDVITVELGRSNKQVQNVNVKYKGVSVADQDHPRFNVTIVKGKDPDIIAIGNIAIPDEFRKRALGKSIVADIYQAIANKTGKTVVNSKGFIDVYGQIQEQNRAGSKVWEGRDSFKPKYDITDVTDTAASIASLVTRANELKYARDSKGILHAEVIVPRGMLTQEHIDAIDRGEELFLYKDAFGFRIPSTELHSAVPLKVVGFYESKHKGRLETNVIIAPRSLVVLHGSDFDVDTLSIIVRPTFKDDQTFLDYDPKSDVDRHIFKAGSPVGFQKNDEGRYIIDKTFDKNINRLILQREYKLRQDRNNLTSDELHYINEEIKSLKRIREQAVKGNIVETMLETITSPRNAVRMGSPISMKELNETIDELGLPRDEDLDLNNYLDRLKAFKSTKDGQALTGIFANNVKALAYMMRAGETITLTLDRENLKRGETDLAMIKKMDNYTEFKNSIYYDDPLFTEVKTLTQAIKLQEKIVETYARVFKETLDKANRGGNYVPRISKNNEFSYKQWNPETKEYVTVTFDRISDYDRFNPKKQTWQRHDSNINAAVDNIKEQLLPVINANPRNANALSALIGVGFPLKSSILLFNHPIIKELTQDHLSKEDVKIGINQWLKQLRTLASQPLDTYKSDFVLSDESITDVINGRDIETILKDITDKKVPTIDELKVLYETVSLFKKAYQLGESLRKMSKFLAIIKGTPVTIGEFENVKTSLDKIGKLTDKDGVGFSLRTSTPRSYHDFDYYANNFKELKLDFNVRGDFGFEIPNFFNKNTHVLAAYKAYLFMEDAITNQFIVHSKQYRKFVDTMTEGFKIDLAKDEEGYTANINKAKQREELVKYLMARVFDVDLSKESKYEYKTYSGYMNTLYGSRAWSQRFLKDVLKAKALDNRLQNKNDALYIPGYEGNLFLESLTVETNRLSKLLEIGFTGGTSLEFDQVLEFQDHFKFLKNFDPNNDTYHTDLGNVKLGHLGYTKFQEDFITFAALNFGFKFGVSNYSLVLPIDIYKEFDENLSLELHNFAHDEELQTRLKQHFEVLLSAANVDALSTIDTLEPVITGSITEKKDTVNTYNGTTTVPMVGLKEQRKKQLLERGDVEFDVEGIIEDEPSKINVWFMGPEGKTNTRKLSNLAKRKFEYLDVKYGSVEHAYQTLKSGTFDRDVYVRGWNDFVENKINAPKIPVQKLQNYSGSRVGADNSLELMKRLVLESFLQNQDSAAATKLLQYEVFTHNTNTLIDQAFIEGLYLAQIALGKEEFNPLEKAKRTVYFDRLYTYTSNRLDNTKYEDIIKIGFGKKARAYVKVYDEWELKTKATTSKPAVLVRKIAYQSMGHAQDGIYDVWNKTDNYKRRDYFSPYKLSLRASQWATDPNKFTSPYLFEGMEGKEAYMIPYDDNARNNRIKVTIVSVTKGGKEGFIYTTKPAISDVVGSGGIMPMMLRTTPGATPAAPAPGPARPKNLKGRLYGREETENPNVVVDKLYDEVDTITVDDTAYYQGRETGERTTSWISKFRVNPLHENPRVYATYRADVWWDEDERPKNNKKWTDEGYITYTDYINKLEESLIRSQNKGNIIHALIQKNLHPGLSAELDSRITEWMSISKLNPFIFKWVKENIKPILTALGTNLYDKDVDKGLKDNVLSEVNIFSKTLKLGGGIDLMIDHADGSITLSDIKTSFHFNRPNNNILKYGHGTTRALTESQSDMAKFQLAMYAFIIKTENPDAKFRDLKILWAPNAHTVNSAHSVVKVDMSNYLPMIKSYLKNEMPDVYEKIKDRKDLFNPSEYSRGYTPDMQTEFNKDLDLLPSQLLKQKLLELKKAVLIELNPHVIRSTEEAKGQFLRGRQAQARKLAEEIAILLADPKMDLKHWEDDMTEISSWLSTTSNVHNPYIQVYEQLRMARKAQYNKRWENVREKFYALLKPVYNKYLEDSGLKSKFSVPIAGRFLGAPDPHKLWAFAYRTEIIDGVPTKVYNYTEDDFAKAAIEHGGRMATADEKVLIRFMLDNFESFFKKNEFTKYDIPLAEQIATTKMIGKNKHITVTNLELANGWTKGKDSKRITSRRTAVKPFVWDKSKFMAITPKTGEEIRAEHGYFSKENFEYLQKTYLTWYVESEFEEWNNVEEGIPMKYLPNGTREFTDNFSIDVEQQFDKFMRSYLFKEEMDDVFSFGKGLQYYLESKSTIDGMPMFKNTSEFLRTMIEMQIRGRKQTSLDPFRRGNQTRVTDKFNWAKALRSFKSLTVAPIMWLKPVTGIANGVFTAIYTYKEAVKGDIVKHYGDTKLLGMSQSVVDFTTSDLTAAFGSVVAMHGRHMLTNKQIDPMYYDDEKVWLLAKQLGYLPDNYDWATNSSELLTLRNKNISQSTMLMFHSVPEEALAMMIMLAQMRNMKVKGVRIDGNDVVADPTGEVSVFDMYVPVTKTINGQEYTTLEWRKDKATGAEYVRGYENTSKLEGRDEFVPITSLDSKEVQKLKRVYEKIHGSYRQDERTRLEYTVLGELFTQYKKYIPNILKNALGSKGEAFNLGDYRFTGNKHNGKEVMEWIARMEEGRWRILGKLIANQFSMRSKYDKPTNTKERIANAMLPQHNENYNWSELTDGQKMDALDFLVTGGMFMMFTIGKTLVAGGAGDDDSLKLILDRITSDFSQQYNPYEIGKNIIENLAPASIEKGYKTMTAMWEMTTSAVWYLGGYEDYALTKEGVIHGWGTFKRSIPFVSSWRDLVHFYNNVGGWEEYLTLRSVQN